MSKIPIFSACGGLNGKNNSIIYSLSVKDGILITFEYKSPRSGEKHLKVFFRREAVKFFWGVFFVTQTQNQKKHCPQAPVLVCVLEPKDTRIVARSGLHVVTALNPKPETLLKSEKSEKI